MRSVLDTITTVAVAGAVMVGATMLCVAAVTGNLDWETRIVTPMPCIRFQTLPVIPRPRVVVREVRSTAPRKIRITQIRR